MLSDKIIIYTYFYGDEFKDLFLSYCYPSMMQAGNIPRLIKAGIKVDWQIHTPFQLEGLHPCCNRQPAHIRNMPDSFLAVATKSFNTKTPVVIVAPDYIVGNNSVFNAVELLKNRVDGCISVAHPRISWEKLNKRSMPGCTPGVPTSNAQLVTLAFEYGHICLLKAFDTLAQNVTWAGISIREISENLYAVIHNLATPFICTFTECDVNYLRTKHFGHFDRSFTKKLLYENRIKLIGSSDICFFVEVTKNRHEPPVRSRYGDALMKYNDKEMAGENHYNQFYVTWRGE